MEYDDEDDDDDDNNGYDSSSWEQPLAAQAPPSSSGRTEGEDSYGEGYDVDGARSDSLGYSDFSDWEDEDQGSNEGSGPELDEDWRQAEELRAKGDLEEAEPAYRELLRDRQVRLGPLHEDVIVATANLASVLRDLDRSKEAEVLYRRALDGSEQALGPSHTTTLAAACNLADVLQEAGQLDEAEPLWRAVVEGRQATLGANHPATLSAILSLGLLQQDLGNPHVAEDLLRQALRGDEEALGHDHPTTVNTVSHLATILLDTDKVAEAASMFRRALESSDRQLGAQHPDTLFAARDYLDVLRELGQTEQIHGVLARFGPHMDPADRRDMYHSLVEVWLRRTTDGQEAASEGGAAPQPQPCMTTIADFCDEALLTAGATYVGDLVEAAPFLADGPLENAALLPGAIVLVGRGGCPFVDKAKRVQDVGGRAMLVVNNAPDELNSNFVGGDTEGAIRIPVLGVSHASGEELRRATGKAFEITVREAKLADLDEELKTGSSGATSGTASEVTNAAGDCGGESEDDYSYSDEDFI